MIERILRESTVGFRMEGRGLDEPGGMVLTHTASKLTGQNSAGVVNQSLGEHDRRG